jgi:hypothetical protein
VERHEIEERMLASAPNRSDRASLSFKHNAGLAIDVIFGVG